MPEGIKLVQWAPKRPPISITTWLLVNDVPGFIRATLGQLDALRRGENWLGGNWSVRDLVDRLEQSGVMVEVENVRKLHATETAENNNKKATAVRNNISTASERGTKAGA